MGLDEEAQRRTQRQQGYWFVAISFTAAAAFALASYAVATYVLDLDLSIIPTVTTAIVVGAFISLIMARPRRRWATFTEGESRPVTSKELTTELDPAEMDAAEMDPGEMDPAGMDDPPAPSDANEEE